MAQDQQTFSRLRIGGWRQFASIDIEFHPRLTVITGANGAGKSTLLNLLSSHLGVSRPYLGVPRKVSGTTEFLTGVFTLRKKLFDWLMRRTDQTWVPVGEIAYSNGATSPISVPAQGSLQYSPNLERQHAILGFHMPSHRLMPNYQQVANLQFGGVDPATAFQQLIQETYSPYMGGSTGHSLLFRLKSILASWAAFGEGNSTLDKDPAQMKAFRGFIEILRQVLPREIGFIELSIQPPDILLKTRSGTFLLDAASGGLLTIIEIAALIYTCSLRSDVKNGPFCVTFDEPENHLHPALQRSLLPTLVEAFPSVQFIVATHSPFMVSSLRDSHVYVLKYESADLAEDTGKRATSEAVRVWSARLDYVNRAGPASDILREVLGVPVTLPVWVEGELQRIVERYDHRPINDATVAALRADVEEAGLSDLFPEAVVRLGEELDPPR